MENAEKSTGGIIIICIHPANIGYYQYKILILIFVDICVIKNS